VIEGRCDLVSQILDVTTKSGVNILDNDIIVLTDKIVSKCLGKVVSIDDVKVSKKALKLARRSGLDPKFVELVLRNSDDLVAVVPIKKLVDYGFIDLRSLTNDPKAMEEILSEYPVFFITLREGMLWSDSGIDSSNLPPGYYVIPIEDHDLIAKLIRDGIHKATGKKVAVVICDTEVFLGGSMDFARGSYGIDPIDRCFACRDLYGKPKYGGVDIVVHEVCSAAALVFKQTSEGVPVAIVRGVEWRECECGFKDSIPKADLLKILKEVVKESVKVLGFKGIVRFLKIIT
jgi:coenzyme F420-0:L-glutamate ligase/coenzyme F420-1:gamma-L-glutamate ligase